MKLKLDYLLTDLLNILEYIWWSLHSIFLFMGMGKRRRKVMCCEIKSYNRNPNITPEIFQI